MSTAIRTDIAEDMVRVLLSLSDAPQSARQISNRVGLTTSETRCVLEALSEACLASVTHPSERWTTRPNATTEIALIRAALEMP